MEEANGVGKGITKDFKDVPISSTLEIHLYWTGKSNTNYMPKEEFVYILDWVLGRSSCQAMQFDEAENLCKKTLEIHRVHSPPASFEEAADRRLMSLIYEAKGDYEAALEHLVLASMDMFANAQENEVAAIDVSIGNIYLSLSHFDEVVFSYQKALTVFKSSKGDNHPSLVSSCEN